MLYLEFGSLIYGYSVLKAQLKNENPTKVQVQQTLRAPFRPLMLFFIPFK